MEIILDLFNTGLLQGLILAFVAFGIMIPFRIVNLPDLTSEGSYSFGSAVTASLLLVNLNPFLAIIIASILGGVLGIITASINIRFKLNSLLAGIITGSMAYSLSLRVMGKPNLAIFNTNTIFFSENIYSQILVIVAILSLLVLVFYLLLKTKFGLNLRAVGFNPKFSESRGVKTSLYIMFAFFIGNMFVGIGSSLLTQIQSYADINMGIGIILHGLAALMVGESLLGTSSIPRLILAPILGALVYQQIQGLVLFVGLEPSDLKFFTAFTVLALISLKRGKV